MEVVGDDRVSAGHGGGPVTCQLLEGASLLELLTVCQRVRDDEREQYEAFTGERYDFEDVAARWHVQPGPRWTVVGTSGGAIVVAGFTMIRPGVWQDWMFSRAEAWDEAHWRPVTRLARRVMDKMLQSGAHRLQCVSLASRTQAHKWYRPLGLRLEGTLHGYGVGGEDALMFARVRSDDGNPD